MSRDTRKCRMIIDPVPMKYILCTVLYCAQCPVLHVLSVLYVYRKLSSIGLTTCPRIGETISVLLS